MHLPTAGVTNPPGIALLREIPRPNQNSNKLAYQITWSPPSYPVTLNHVKYSLDTGSSRTLTETNSAEDFLGNFGYQYIYTFVVDAKSGKTLSDHSPHFWDEIRGTCNRHGEREIDVVLNSLCMYDKFCVN